MTATGTDQCPNRRGKEHCRPLQIGANWKGTVWRCEKHSVAFVTGPDGKLVKTDTAGHS